MTTWGISIRSGATKARIAVNLMQAFALLVINAFCEGSYYGSLMFRSPRLNTLATDVTLLLPTLSLIFLWLSLYPRWSQPPLSTPRSLLAVRCGIVTLIPISVICLFGVALASSSIRESEGFESSPEFMRNVPVSGPPVRIYGASGHDPELIWIQQERTLLPGLLWVTQLGKWDEWDGEEDSDSDTDTANPHASINVKVLDRHHLRCTYHPDGKGHKDTIAVVENP